MIRQNNTCFVVAIIATRSSVSSRLTSSAESDEGFDPSKLPIRPMAPERVARAGLEALGRKALVIPGAMNKFADALGSMPSRAPSPRSWPHPSWRRRSPIADACLRFAAWRSAPAAGHPTVCDRLRCGAMAELINAERLRHGTRSRCSHDDRRRRSSRGDRARAMRRPGTGAAGRGSR